MAGLKLININIEGDKHWDRVLPFLSTEAPDVLCVQELYRDELEKITGFSSSTFLPNTRRPHTAGGVSVEFGMALFTKTPPVRTHTKYYDRNGPTELPEFDKSTPERLHDTYWHGYVAADVVQGGSRFSIITTHCTWTPHGEAERYQLEDVEDMKHLLADEGEHVLCGDFNIPRGKNPIANLLSQGYTDQIPPNYHGSMDMQFHRTRGTPEAARVATNMVDYLFTTALYSAEDVRLVPGVSDHMAIVATITRS